MSTSQIDAEIGKKDHFWMETRVGTGYGVPPRMDRILPVLDAEFVDGPLDNIHYRPHFFPKKDV